MISRSVSFEWHMGEEVYLGVAQAPDVTADVRRAWPLIDRQTRRKALFIRDALIVFAIGVVAAGGFLLSQHLERVNTREGIQTSLNLETEAWQNDDKSLFDSLRDPQANKKWSDSLNWTWHSLRRQKWQDLTVTMQDIEFHEDYIWVKAENRYAGPDRIPVTYSQYRFYIQVEDTWLRTHPDKSFWGQPQSMETSHLAFEYHELDADIIEAIAPQLDQTYIDLYQLVGIEPPNLDEKLKIEVVKRTVGSWATAGDHLRVSSYVLEPMASTVSDTEGYAQSVISRMALQALNQIKRPERYSSSRLWRTVFSGLHSWLVMDVTGYPHVWYDGADLALEQELRERGSLKLSDLQRRSYSDTERNELLWRVKASETIVQYIVLTYGRDQLPTLLQALASYPTWEELLLGAYNISQSDFEQGWNQYLDEQF